MNEYHYVYKTHCQETGEFYIGKHSTTNLNDGYQGSGTLLKSKIKDGFVFKTEILEQFQTSKEALEYESSIVTLDLINNPLCLNQCTGGGGGTFGYKHSDETIKRLRKAATGKTHTEETRKRLSKLSKGKTLTVEHRNILSKTHKGKVVSEETKRKSAQTQSIGYWVTPKGTFLNVREAAKANNCDRGTLRRRCQQSGKKPVVGYAFFKHKE